MHPIMIKNKMIDEKNALRATFFNGNKCAVGKTY